MVEIAQYGIILLLSASLLFHLLVVSKIIPYNIVWGGKLNSEKEMIRFEIVSIIVNLFLLLLILTHTKILDFNIPAQFLKIGMWVMAVLFALNTLGNIFSKNKFEKRIFTPVTLILTILSVILALKG